MNAELLTKLLNAGIRNDRERDPSPEETAAREAFWTKVDRFDVNDLLITDKSDSATKIALEVLYEKQELERQVAELRMQHLELTEETARLKRASSGGRKKQT